MVTGLPQRQNLHKEKRNQSANMMRSHLEQGSSKQADSWGCLGGDPNTLESTRPQASSTFLPCLDGVEMTLDLEMAAKSLLTEDNAMSRFFLPASVKWTRAHMNVYGPSQL